jgi:hypothetical protein
VPKGDWGHGSRPWHPERDRLFPVLEHTPDLTRGEVRFASEVMLLAISGLYVPEPILQRALSIAHVMAEG